MTLQNAASHLGLFCLHRGISSKNRIEHSTPKNESGLIQLIMVGKSICQIWVNDNIKVLVVTRTGEPHRSQSLSLKSGYIESCILKSYSRECGGVVVERRTPNRKVLDSIPTGIAVLCP